MAAGYRLFASWLARSGLTVRAVGGDRKAVITLIYNHVASITD